VELTHLTPEGRLQFNLPGVVPVCRLQPKGKDEVDTITMNLDTVFIASDERTLCMVWRGRAPIDDIDDDKFELASIAIRSTEQAP
jgi:hypothetical protein